MRVKSECIDEFLEVICEPVGDWNNILATLHGRAEGPIKDKYGEDASVEELCELEEERAKLWVLAGCCMPRMEKHSLGLTHPDAAWP